MMNDLMNFNMLFINITQEQYVAYILYDMHAILWGHILCIISI